jgi:hypothetical protein
MNLLFNLQLASLARLQIELVTLFSFPQFSVYIKIVLLTFRSTTERVPGSFDEELALRAIAQQLRRKRIKYAKKLVAKKVKKDDEINSLSGSDVDANVHSFADSPKTQTPRETNDISKEEMLDKIFGRTVGESGKFEEIEWLLFPPMVNGPLTNWNSDEKKGTSSSNEIPKPRSDDKYVGSENHRSQ